MSYLCKARFLRVAVIQSKYHKKNQYGTDYEGHDVQTDQGFEKWFGDKQVDTCH